MLSKEQFKHLKNRAEMQLAKTCAQPAILANNSKIREFLWELNLYQTELEIQNQDLINSQFEIERSHSKYLEFYEHAPGGYFTINPDGLIIEVNQPGAELLQTRKLELIDHHFSMFVDTAYHASFHNYLQSILQSNETQTCELKLIRKDGSFFYAVLYAKSTSTAILDDAKIWMFITNINQRKQDHIRVQYNQQKISYIDRMNSINKLHAVSENEITQPLTIIGNYLNGCISRMDANSHNMDDLHKSVRESIKQIKRTTDISLNLKNFSCKNKLSFKHICIKKMITEAFNLLKDELSNYQIDFEFRIPKNLPQVMADEVYVKHVIISLARNSFDAMQEANTFEPKIIVEINLHDMKSLEVCIRDNGPGLSGQEYEHLFSPNFTTKLYGTGISLSMCRAIIESHGGIIEAESNISSGISVKFTLPIAKN